MLLSSHQLDNNNGVCHKHANISTAIATTTSVLQRIEKIVYTLMKKEALYKLPAAYG
jgi:hypothetical protein